MKPSFHAHGDDTIIIDVEGSIDSGQVFLWSRAGERAELSTSTESTPALGPWWYGVNGREILKIDEHSGKVLSYRDKRWAADTNDFFRTDDDAGAICRSISVDRTVKKAAKRYPGLRILRQDPYQCMISFLISTNSNIQRIRTNLADITTEFGDPVRVDGEKFFLFPRPDKLADASEQEVRKCGVGYRAEYVIEASKMLLSREIDLESKENDAYHDVMSKMLAIPGVGNKVADCIMLFSLDRPDAFPLDRWMIRVLQRYYGSRLDIGQITTLTDKQYRKLHDKIVKYFGPYAGYAQQLLFKMERDDHGAAWRPRSGAPAP